MYTNLTTINQLKTQTNDTLNYYLECLQHWHLVEQFLVELALLEGALEQDAAEGVAVHGPQRAGGLRAHGRGARHVVHQRQLTERP